MVVRTSSIVTLARFLAIFAVLFIPGVRSVKCSIPKLSPKHGQEDAKRYRKFRHRKSFVWEAGLVKDWPAHEAWQSERDFRAKYGSLLVSIQRPDLRARRGQTHPKTTIEEYLQRELEGDGNDYIQFEFGNLAAYRSMLPDISPRPDFLKLVHERPIVSLGRNNTGSAGHSHEEVWMAQVTGKKLWIVAPPRGKTQQWPSTTMLPCSLLQVRDTFPPGTQSCVVEPGEVISVPNDWYHATCNLDDFTLSIGGKGNSDNWPEHMFHIQRGDAEALEAAAGAGIDLKQGGGGLQPLHFAAAAGVREVFDVLISHGLDPREVDGSGQLIIHIAAEQGHVSIMERILELGIGSLNDRVKKSSTDAQITGWTPLHDFGIDSEVARWLVKSRADVNARDVHGRTPIHTVITKGHEKPIQTLLELRADPTTPDLRGADALATASEKGYVHIMQLLLQHGMKAGKSWSHMHYAARNGHLQSAKLLVEQRASVNEPDPQWLRGAPLAWAAAKGHSQLVQYLLNQRADARHRDANGGTALDAADSSKALPEAARQLLRSAMASKDGSYPGKKQEL